MHRYNHKIIEKKWQKDWEEKGLHKTEDKVSGKENKYFLSEFPYPSGNLHVGHWYAFALFDIFVRKKRMEGFNVLYPIGFDAFGLPAENAAIKRNLNPREWTFDNIKHMRSQLASMGASFDWSREVVTADPSYYKWTQWLFLKFIENGLAEQRKTEVNWCPSCKTVLANEQVIAGECERCGHKVEKKEMLQWVMKITQYADRLLSDLEPLDWPEEIKVAQKNWIGKSEGTEIEFGIKNTESRIKVFTTRPDTLFGATYLVIAPEHKFVQQLLENQESGIKNQEEVEEYIKKAKGKSELERQEFKEKTGVELKGITAINPGSGEEVPVWVADYVLAGYGTGAIMAVPAHDERDFEFAKKFNLLVNKVVQSEAKNELPYSGIGVLVNSGKFDRLTSEEAKEKITKEFGEKKTTYRIRDWVISRQRYWGCPIPVIHCPKCGAVPVPESDLPVVLPEVEDYLPREDGKSPLAKATDWMRVKCPKCSGDAERETDTLDTFIDSSWYYLRYLDSHNDKEFSSGDKQDFWMPIDFYSGGSEHTTMHLLYSRFFHKALFDFGLVAEPEPFKKRANRGLILGTDGNKMSKSKGNVLDPDEIVERLGADTVRAYMAFIGPYNEPGYYPWDPDGVVGMRRFLERVFKIAEKVNPSTDVNKDIFKLSEKSVKKVTEDIDEHKFNTALAQMMVFSNTLNKEESVSKETFEVFLKLLAPFAPHVAEELWHELGNENSIHLEGWPTYDAKNLEEDEVTMAVQVNGKVRTEIKVSTDEGDEVVKEKAVTAVEKWVGESEIKKVILVPGRLVNIVV